MARGKWLSNEEKVGILKMHAAGMTAAEIASIMQRGVKSIQRVLSPRRAAANGELGELENLLSPLSETEATPPEAPSPLQVDTVTVPPSTTQGATTIPRACGQPAVASLTDLKQPPVKGPKRPRKSSSKTIPVTVAKGKRCGIPALKLVEDTPISRSQVHHQSLPARTASMLPAQSSELATPFSLSPSQPVQMLRPLIGLLHGQQHKANTSREIVHDLRRMAHMSVTQPTHPLSDISCIVDIIPDRSSDDDKSPDKKERQPSDKPRAPLHLGGEIGDHPRNTVQRRIQDAVPLGDKLASQQSVISTAVRTYETSPLLRFENQLQQTPHEPSQCAEPTAVKKRKLGQLGEKTPEETSIERTLLMVGEAITSCAESHESGIYEDRLALMLQRFQAELRLLQLEKSCHQVKCT